MNAILEINDNFKMKTNIPLDSIKWVLPVTLFSNICAQRKTINLEFIYSGRTKVEEEIHIYSDGEKDIKKIIKTLYRIFELEDVTIERFNSGGFFDVNKK